MKDAFRTFLFDCDSTLSRIEGIDEIARGRADVLALTKAAMDGTIPLDEVYGRRLELVRPSRADLERVAARYVAEATEDAAAVVSALQKLGKIVRIVSGGLRTALIPLAEKLEIPADRLHSVDVRFDSSGAYSGFDSSSPLARRGGKAEVARNLVAAGGRPAVMIGDGITDLEAATEVDLFIGYGGVEDREAVRKASPVFIRCESLAPILAICLTEAEKKTLSASPDGAALLRKAEDLARIGSGAGQPALDRNFDGLALFLMAQLGHLNRGFRPRFRGSLTGIAPPRPTGRKAKSPRAAAREEPEADGSVHERAMSRAIGSIQRLALLIAVSWLVQSVGRAQESRPDSRPDGSIRFHRVAGAVVQHGVPLVASASDGENSISVWDDGTVACSLVRQGAPRWTFDRNVPTETRHLMARLSSTALQRIRESSARVVAGGSSIAMPELLASARVPPWARDSHSAPGATLSRVRWLRRHQEPDGSWSPVDFAWNCEGDHECSGTGAEGFRTTATALAAACMLETEGRSDAVLSALRFLMARQRADGSFADDQDSSPAMTQACAALALCLGSLKSGAVKVVRSGRMAVGRLLDNQHPDGSWAEETETPERRLSIATWSLLALQAGATAGFVSDFSPMQRGARWICAASGSIETRGRLVGDRRATSRALVSRAIAREFIGGDSEELVSYRDYLREELDRGVESLQDAETLLWSMLALSKHSGDVSQAVRQQLADIVAASEGRGPCPSGSWIVPSLWSDQGGRLVSTALMAWAGKARHGSRRLRFR